MDKMPQEYLYFAFIDCFHDFGSSFSPYLLGKAFKDLFVWVILWNLGSRDLESLKDNYVNLGEKQSNTEIGNICSVLRLVDWMEKSYGCYVFSQDWVKLLVFLRSKRISRKSLSSEMWRIMGGT